MGHQMLRSWGDRIKNHLRDNLPNAIASYWGNGEFVLGLPGLALSETEDAIAPLLQTFRQLIFSPIANRDTKSQRFQSQYAVGLSHFPQQAATLASLYQIAHAAMSDIAKAKEDVHKEK